MTTLQLSYNSKTLNLTSHKPELLFQIGAINPRSPVTANAKVSSLPLQKNIF